MDIGDSFRDAFDEIVAFLPKLLGFLIILIVGYIIAKVLTKVITTVLQKVGFDRAVERGGIKKALANSQYDASAILAKIVFYFIMLFVLSTAFGVFGSNPISDYLSAIINYLPLVFVAIVIVVIAAAIAAAAKALIENTLSGLSYGTILANVASGLILALGLIAALNQLHIAENVVNAVLYAALAAIVGILIVAVGGGGVKTMSTRWEAVATRYDEEKPKVAEQVRQAPGLRQQAQQARDQFQDQGQQGGPQQGGPQPGATQYQPVQQGGQPAYGGQWGAPEGGQWGGQPDGGQQPAPQGGGQQPGGQQPGGQQWTPQPWDQPQPGQGQPGQGQEYPPQPQVYPPHYPPPVEPR